MIGVEPATEETSVSRKPCSTRWGAVPTAAVRRRPGGAVRMLAALLALSGVLLSPGPQAPAAGAADATLIVPGASLGPAMLGMTRNDLVAVLGRAVQGQAGTLEFPKWGVIAIMQGGVAVRLSTASPRFHTLDGAGVGSRQDEATRLVGDMNSVVTQYGIETTVLYPFQGVGFVFRGGRAVTAFVIGRIGLGPQVTPPSAPAATSGLVPLPPGAPPAPPGPTLLPSIPQRPGGSVSVPSLALRDLAETVHGAGLIRIAGKVANTGQEATGPVAVTVVFGWLSGDKSQKQVTVADRIAPGAEVPFTVVASVATDLIIRYTVRVLADAAPSVEETRTVPPQAYTEFAKQKIKMDVQLGAPDSTSRARGVQALVSIKDTSPIPIRWVKDVLVLIPAASGAQSGQPVRVTPGQTVTVIIPLAPNSLMVMGPAGATTTTTTGSVVPLVGQPQILDVTLGPS